MNRLFEFDSCFSKIFNQNCLDGLIALESNSIDLIITSPPYADQRSATYTAIKPDHYVEWFLPITSELFRVLKPTGRAV